MSSHNGRDSPLLASDKHTNQYIDQPSDKHTNQPIDQSIDHPPSWTWRHVPKRYIMCLMLTLSNILCYADRTNISIAVLPENIHLENDSQRGQVLAGFFYGYITTQLLGGILSSRYGGKPVLLMGVCLWIVCDGLTVPAALSGSFAFLMAARIGMGCGEGVNFPTDHQLIASWFSQQERSTMLAITAAGIDMGTIISSGLSPLIAEKAGWQMVYMIYCFLGAVWLLVFSIVAASKPEWHPTIRPEERDYVMNNRGSHVARVEEVEYSDDAQLVSAPKHVSLQSQPPAAVTGWRSLLLSHDGTPVPWSRYFRSKSLYGIMGAHFFFNYAFYVFLSWLPLYFQRSLGVNLAKSGFITTAAPYMAGAVGNIVAGQISTILIKRGWRTKYVRILMNSIGGLMPAIAMTYIAIALPTSVPVTVGILSAGYFFFRFANLGYWISMVDIGRAHCSQIMGISNTMATVPGIVGNVITGEILSATGSWSLIFAIAAGAFTLGAICFALLADDHDIGEEFLRERREAEEQETSG